MQTQVLPYLRELVDELSLEVHLLTFERDPIAKDEQAEMKARLAESGITWIASRYHKWPSAIATAWDILVGTWITWRSIGRGELDVIHGRSHVPTLMGALGRVFSRRKPKLLFDIRGFFPEEYTDAGVWKHDGLLFRSAKRIEKWLMSESDGFVVLTEAARDVLFPIAAREGRDELGRPVAVIPCCVDLQRRFAERPNGNNGATGYMSDRYVVAHVGALGGLYLTREIADLMATVRKRRPDAYALILTQTKSSGIEEMLEEQGFSRDDYFVAQVPPERMAEYLKHAKLGVSLVKSSYSTLSRSPTKIPEYLACGVPIVANAGVGDVDKLIADNDVGAVIREFKEDAYASAVEKVEEMRRTGTLEERCRLTAYENFDLEKVGRAGYARLYKSVLHG